MTIPRERAQSIKNTKEFLRRLLDPKQTPRIPREIRRQAYWCLRHFPTDWEMEATQEACPEIWGDPDETNSD